MNAIGARPSSGSLSSTTSTPGKKSTAKFRAARSPRCESLDTDTIEAMDSERRRYLVTWPKVEHGIGFPARAFAILP